MAPWRGLAEAKQLVAVQVSVILCAFRCVHVNGGDMLGKSGDRVGRGDDVGVKCVQYGDVALRYIKAGPIGVKS